jgi:hypothetical protein
VLVSLQKNDHDFELSCALKGAFVLCAHFVSFVLFVAKKRSVYCLTICVLLHHKEHKAHKELTKKEFVSHRGHRSTNREEPTTERAEH